MFKSFETEKRSCSSDSVAANFPFDGCGRTTLQDGQRATVGPVRMEMCWECSVGY